MKLKTDLIIIALIIAMFFTVSSVCAEDSEIQAISAHNSTHEVMGAVDENDLEMNHDNEALAESYDFDALNQTINGNPTQDYIELENDYRGSQFNGGQGIEINRDNVVIDGKGHTIDCTGQNSRMFNIDKNNITLKNIKFTGGRSDIGGAICTTKSLTVINCTFIDNQATSGNDVNGGGGAIFCNDVKLSFYNCTFENNYANSNGGAIIAVGENSNDCEIFNCTFINNAAGKFGGAFYSLADKSMGNIINSTFINSRAESADAIYTKADVATIDRCVFINNTASGMISAPYAEMTLSNSIIVNNYGDSLVEAPDPNINYNWWGTTADDIESPVVSGIILDNFYVLNMTVDDDSADITLNNLYDNGVITTSYDKYDLPSINFTVKASKVEVADSVVLGASGETTIEHAPAGEYQITICYNGVELTREVKPSFKYLRDKLNEDCSEYSLEQDCIYDSAKDSSLTNGIEFAKDMVIDGQGHIIDAKGLSNIFYFDDATNSYNLTLKNIVFANATRSEGAAVYFKGNKIEIINCTFINNSADSQGDAVYVANALSNANRITQSVFKENAGSNSVVCLNLDSNANLILDNSVFMNNSAAINVKGSGNVVLEYDWWGNTDENNENISKTEGVKLNNWLFLKIDAVPAMNGDATLSLNNVYDHGTTSTYSEYSLQPLTFSLGGLNATISVPEIILGDNGQANYQFRMDRALAELTASYDDVTTAKQLEYVVVDDGSFRALNEIIFFSDDGEVIELTHDYMYFDNDTITEGIVIPRKITINGNGHTIDAKSKTRIFMVPEGVSQVNINNVSFINAQSSYGSVIVISHYSNFFNFSNCNFTDNVATDYGGVIDCVGDYCSIENCNFVNNRAVSKAGVIRYYHDTRAYIKNSNFIENRVADGSNGGGVIYGDAGAVIIDRSTFINNVANDKEGSVLYTLKEATVTNSIFLNNHGINSIKGQSSVVLTNNWFGNTSLDYNLNTTLSCVSNEVTLNNWLYLDMKFFDDFVIVSLNNAFNKSSNSTGVISNYNLPELTFNLNSTTLNLTEGNVTLDGKGQARVYYTKISQDGELTLSNEFVSLTKDAIVCDFDVLQWLIDENEVVELNRDYAYTSADSIEEGIVIAHNVTVDGKGHVIDAKEMTRIFNVQALNVTFKNIIFANGKASIGDGGAIYCSQDNGQAIEFNVINCTFVNNTADKDNSTSLPYSGGAIYIKSNEGVFNIEDSVFIDNCAENMGGAIYINARNAEFNLLNSSFSGNTANHDGALFIETDSTEITIDKCIFRKNKAINSSYESNGNAIVWKTSNDNKNSAVRNSVILENGPQENGMHAFLLLSGNVTIDDNWWGTTAQDNPETFNLSIVGGMAPDTWLFINSEASSYNLSYNQTATLGYYLQVHNGTQASEFDNSRLPRIDFNVTCDVGKLDKSKVSLGEEFTYTADDVGNGIISIFCNGIVYDIKINGPYMAPIVDEPFIIYANQSFSKIIFIRTADGDCSNVSISCNDSSLIDCTGDNVIGLLKNGTARLTFSYSGSSEYIAQDLDLDVKVVKVPLEISVAKLKGSEITLNVTDALDLDIAFEINETHAGYAPAWDTMGADYNSSVISFEHGPSERPANGSYYATARVTAVGGGVTDLTIYSTSDAFAFENFTIRITVNKIPTSIEIDSADSFKVDDACNINATFYINGTSSPQQLIYESSDVNVVNFTSDSGDFHAGANGSAVLTVKFSGNSTHESYQISLPVTVTKTATETVIASGKSLSLRIGEKSQIDAGVNPGSAGNLTYSSSNESVATVSSAGLITAHRNGTATITVRYPGNWKYEGSQDSIAVVVLKNATQITAEDKVLNSTDENIQIGAVVNVTGEYTLHYSISNESVVTVSDDGRLTAVGGGQTQVTITYDESEKYLSCTMTITVTVNKLETEINASEIKAKYLEKITLNPDVVNVNGTSIGMGYITYFIGDSQISDALALGEGFTFTVDRVGKFNITAKYAENAKYMPSELNITVNSDKADNLITVVVDDATYPENVTVRLNATVEGTYTVDINGTKYSVVANDTAGISVKLAAGSYCANITGYESQYYYGVTTNDTFTIDRAAINVEVSVDDIYLPGNVTVKVTADMDGIYDVDINGTMASVNVENGEGSNTVELPAGAGYVAKTSFADLQNYTVSIKNATFDVKKSDISLEIIINEIIYGQNVTGTINTNLSGTYTVKIVDRETFSLDLQKGSNTFTLQILLPVAKGYVAEVSIAESDYYNAKFANTTFDVELTGTDFNATSSQDEYSYGDEVILKIELPGDATGSVSFNYTDGSFIGMIEDVTASQEYAMPVLKTGSYTIQARYSGDSNYKPRTQTINFKVNPADNHITVNVDDVAYPDAVTVNVTADVDDTYIVSINGTDYYIIANGEGLSIQLAAGTYYANVTYHNENYTTLSRNATFTVSKMLPKINATDMVVNVGDIEAIVVEAPGDFDGKFSFESSDEAIAEVNRTGVVTAVSGGTATVTIKSFGSQNYSDDSIEITVTVNKIDSGIGVETVSFDVDVNANASIIVNRGEFDGAIEFISNDTSVAMVDENGAVTGVSAGKAKVTVNATGSSKYNDAAFEVTVNVKRIASDIGVEKDSFDVDVNANESIVITGEFDGDISFTSNDTSVAIVDESGAVTGVSSGKAKITVNATGSSKYYDASVEVIVTVNRVALNLKADDIEIEIDASKAIVIEPADFDGKITYVSSNSSIARVDANGNVTGIAAGNATITITASNSSKYTDESIVVNVTVNRINANGLEIACENPLEIYVGDSYAIAASDKFDRKISYSSSNESIAGVDSKGQITSIMAGTVNVTVSVDGDDRYLAESRNVTVIVKKKSADINVSDSFEIDVKEIRAIVIDVPADYDGNISFEINDTSVASVDGEGRVTGIRAGKATVTVTFKDSPTYLDESFEVNVSVARVSLNLSVNQTSMELIGGEKAGLNVSYDAGYDGEIIFASSNSSVVTVDGAGLVTAVNEGTATITVNASKTDRYFGDSKKVTVTVFKLAYDITLDIEDITAGENATAVIATTDAGLINLTLSKASGVVKSEIVDVDGDFEYVISGLTVGRYTISVKYMGSERYRASEIAKEFTVNPIHDFEFIVEVADTVLGQTTNATVSLPENATGTIRIDGVEYEIGDAILLPIQNVSGRNTVLAQYVPDAKSPYAGVNVTAYYNVAKKNPDINIIIGEALKAGEIAEITIETYEGADITVYVDGESQTVNESKVTIAAKAGTHTIIAEVAENDEYNALTANRIFEVTKRVPEFTISSSDVRVGQKAVIDINITYSATGIVIVNVNGTEYAVDLNNTRSVEVLLERIGKYDISAKYLGDEIYSEAESNNLTVQATGKANSNLHVEIPDRVNVGDVIIINVTSDNANLKVMINGIAHKVNDGKVEYEVSKAGTYPVFVKAAETADYKEQTYLSAFTAEKISASVTISIGDVEIGRDVVVTVASYDGADIKVTVDGAAQTLTNNSFKIRATGGTHTITAVVEETEWYLRASANATFTVERLESQITVNATNTKEGEYATVSVNVTEGATGIVIVSVAGNEYAIDLNESDCLSVLMNASGRFNVTARYLGDEIFSPSQSSAVIIEVEEKQKPNVNVELPEIKAGDGGNITLNIENATGNVSVIIDGVEAVVTLDENGSVVIPVENAPAGNHTVTVIYHGDENNAASIQTLPFNIDKKASELDVKVEDVELGKDSQIEISIPNATGNVSVIIDGVETVMELDENGNLNVTVPSLASDKHSIVVVYRGDYTHAPAVITKYLNATAKSTELKNISVSGNGTITAVLVDGEGNVMNNTNITYIVDGETKTATTDENGEIIIHASPDSKVEIDYSGDGQTMPSNATIEIRNLTPIRHITQIRAEQYTTYAIDFYAGERGNYFRVQLLDELGRPVADKPVKIGFNGVVYDVRTDANGWTKLQINLVKSDVYTFAVAFLGDDDYTASFAVQKIIVNKKPTGITAPAKSYKASAKKKSYTVTLKTVPGSSVTGKAVIKAGKKVTLKLKGKTYTAKTNSKGQVTFKLSISKKGKYTAAVYFKGDDTYLASSAKAKITIR